jgi:DNA polymerase III alpha subunit (gram-positive type)
MREIVLDTETTGISVKEGHRIVEIGCIELENLIPTKNKFHCYLNPERKVSEKAFIGKNILHLAVFKKDDKRTIYNLSACFFNKPQVKAQIMQGCNLFC